MIGYHESDGAGRNPLNRHLDRAEAMMARSTIDHVNAAPEYATRVAPELPRAWRNDCAALSCAVFYWKAHR